MYNYNQGRSFEEGVAQLNELLAELPSLIANTPAQWLETPSQLGKWSPKQILGHLVDSALNNLQRFLNVRFEEKPYAIVPYPQMELVRANAYHLQATEDIVNLLVALNRQILHVVGTYTKAERAYEVEVQTEGFVQTISWWFDDYLGHFEHHIAQIKSQIETQ